ncbi:hypothetical protein LWM68_36710 [Niabella sp. W65]|nr:hypothetical protein [Niabella sp. W65]MCH7367803.1 hypothetical protein [Niabella sp. W65]ULT43268.1 hypothetical protein KRR40_07245 [Niabella sp. I65]
MLARLSICQELFAHIAWYSTELFSIQDQSSGYSAIAQLLQEDMQDEIQPAFIQRGLIIISHFLSRLGFANIFYLQRVRANIFYDYTRVSDKNNTRHATLQSTGAEIYFDTKWWNQHPLTFGFRAGTLLTAIPGQNSNTFLNLYYPRT